MDRNIACFLVCILVNRVISYRDVEIDSGVVRGYTAEDGDYFAYLGIPYAIPPLGLSRFKAPLPPQPWDNVFIANRTVRCPQVGKGDEDCLVVNVFTPTTDIEEPLPVLVYIHGGGYLMGWGPTKGIVPLIQQNVLVVTINYRLGALGFLCLGVDEAPGNAGLKDQVAALKWVHQNIAEFGGDPKQVTIYGMSVGGASVDFQVLSNMAKGLFHKAIIESGVATAPWSVDAQPMKTAKEFAEAFGFKNKNLYELVDFYRRLPADQLSVANVEYFKTLTDGTIGFVPCIERKLSGVDPFITESPRKITKKNAYNKVPLMFIFATLEGLYLKSTNYYEMDYKKRMQEGFRDFMVPDLVFDTEKIRDQITETVRYFYFGNNTIGDNTLMEYLDYFGDSLILHGLLTSVVNYAKRDNTVYLMEFAYKGKLGSYDKFYEYINMSGHGEASLYTFLEKKIEDKDDKVAVDRMAKLIGNFVSYADPTPTQTDLFPLHWPAVSPNNITYLHFDRDLKISEKPYWERKVFWDQLYKVYRRPDIKPFKNGML